MRALLFVAGALERLSVTGACQVHANDGLHVVRSNEIRQSAAVRKTRGHESMMSHLLCGTLELGTYVLPSGCVCTT